MEKNQIFSPVNLGNLRVKNKIARSATFSFMDNPEGFLTDYEIGIYEQLAKNEVGLLFTGMMCVSSNGIFDYDGPLVTDDKYLSKHRQLVEVVHNYGAKIVPQINHVGARVSSKIKETPVTPSPVAMANGQMTKELTIDEIKQIKEDFVLAADRVKRAGFDGVQIHAAHGYLVTQFLNPLTNQRTDEYGGSIENRSRLLREIIKAVIEKCGPEFPVLVKINNNSEQDDVYEGELIYVLQEMKKLGVSAVELSGYNWRTYSINEHNYFIERAARMRETVGIPIILVGGVRSLEDMRTVLDAGIDMISLARPLISEPELITKLKSGNHKARCISCNKCFVLPSSENKRCVFHQANPA